MMERTKAIEELARYLHNEYEKASKRVNWKTQKSCRVSFDNLPKENKRVMLIIARKVRKLIADANLEGLYNCPYEENLRKPKKLEGSDGIRN